MDLPETLYRAAQVRELDRLAMTEFGMGDGLLMSRAGEAALTLLRARWPAARRIAVCCGLGNNGGDGYVVARLARAAGLQVTVMQVGDARRLSGDALAMRHALLDAGVAIEPFTGSALSEVELVVDALLGTGLDRPVEGVWQTAITAINQSGLPVLALDIPSGLHADTGQALGSAIKAQITLSFIGLKQGLFTGDAPDYCGKIHFTDLGVPPELFERLTPAAQRINLAILAGLSPRPRVSNKGSNGHVLIVGGDHGMAGAARLAAEAAARVGAGLVSIATRVAHAAALIASRPELLCHGVKSAGEIAPLLKTASVIAIGPGLGRSGWADKLLAAVLDSPLPLVVDADALNLLSQNHPVRRENWILTPHLGEAARLLGCRTAEVQADRFAAVTELQNRYGGSVLLKGAGTLIAGAAGALAVCDAGNPGMASGGMGDVLTGVIAGLLAQGLECDHATRLGVCLHAAAGDRAADDGERGMLASDLFPWLRRLGQSAMSTVLVATEADMEALGGVLASNMVRSGLVYLQGELGAGKTTLVRGLLRALGHNGAVKSPTYTLVESYSLAQRQLYHFDLYRLVDQEELEYIGIRDYVNADALCLVEWPERGAGVLPEADLAITIQYAATGRQVTLDARSATGRRLLEGILG